MSTSHLMRLFVAAEVPEAFNSAFASILPELRRSITGARWSRPGAVHLTFKFLGGTDPGRLRAVIDAVTVQTGANPPFVLQTAGPGYFGSRTRPRVLWTAIEGDLQAAGRIAGSLEKAMEPLGFPREDRPFRPHLTLARLDGSRGQAISEGLERTAEKLGGIPFPVNELVLFESFLGPDGARYVPHNRFPLLGEADGS